MPSPLVLVLATLAVYRVAFMVTVENGPFDAFLRLRSWANEKWGIDSWQAEGLACPLCASFWLTLPVAILLATPATLLLVWLGMAGAIVVIHNR